MCRLCDVRTMRGLFSFDISLILLRFYFSLRAVCFSRERGLRFSSYREFHKCGDKFCECNI